MSKVWLVTGSSRGLGRELAQAVLAAGDRLIATARKADDVRALVADYGDRARAITLDVTDEAAARAAVAQAVEAFGRLDVVVNNAGYANVNSIEDLPPADFRAQLETNFFGVVNVSRAALAIMHAQRSGHIIQVSSVGGRVASPGLGAYQAAKHAVGGFSEVLAREVAPLGIRVTVVEPGGMRTDWAGPSMRIDTLRDDYRPSIGGFAESVRGLSDTMRGDPAKVAQLILRVAASEHPPLRILAGTDAMFIARKVAAARAAEDAAWRELSASTDREGLIDFADTAVAKLLR